MYKLIAIASLLAPCSAIAAEQPRQFDVTNFSAVELASSDHVEIVSGADFSVTADGDSRAVASLAIDVRNEILRIGRTSGRQHGKGAVITITMPSIRRASLAGSGSINLRDVEASSLHLVLRGSGDIRATGDVEAMTIDLSGSGDIDTRRLMARNIKLEFGGSGSVASAATETATVNAGGTGSVRIIGKPVCEIWKSGPVSVRCG